MHTLISLEKGVLELTLEADDEPVDRAAWYGIITPAIVWLTAWGGGAILLPHRPGDLAS